MKDKKIIVIDDDPQITSTLSGLLAEAGAITSTASTYDEGLAMVAKEHPDVAVVDVMLGTLSGLDLVKAIKAGPPPHPFFIVLTNSINAVHIAEAMEANVTTFIQKADHDPNEIVSMIAKRIGENEQK